MSGSSTLDTVERMNNLKNENFNDSYFFFKFSRFWQDQDMSVQDFVLSEKLYPGYELPSYVYGEFMSSGPS